MQGYANPSIKLCRCGSQKKYICNSKKKKISILAAGGPFCGLHADADKIGLDVSDIAHQEAPKNVLPEAAKALLATNDAHFVDIKPLQIVYSNCICNLYKNIYIL